MAASAIDLCLASAVAADLGVSEDAAVQRCVTAASRAIATYCGRLFHRADGIVESPTSRGRPALLLERAPVLGVTSVVLFGQVLDSTGYSSAGRNAEAGILLRKGACWPLVARDAGGIVPRLEVVEGDGSLTVTYDAGWVTPGQVALGEFAEVTLPEDVQEAAILAAVAFYRRRGTDPNVASESLGDWSVSYAGRGTAVALPDAALQLLASYVRQVVA